MPPRRSTSNSTAGPRASAAHFRVDWGGPAGTDAFLRVDLPLLSADGPPGELVLTRAVSTDASLFAWFQAAQGPKPVKPRTLVVEAFAAPGGAPVLRLAFAGARPLRFLHGPLDALSGGLLTESLALAFDSVKRLG